MPVPNGRPGRRVIRRVGEAGIWRSILLNISQVDNNYPSAGDYTLRVVHLPVLSSRVEPAGACTESAAVAFRRICMW